MKEYMRIVLKVIFLLPIFLLLLCVLFAPACATMMFLMIKFGFSVALLGVLWAFPMVFVMGWACKYVDRFLLFVLDKIDGIGK